MIKAIVGANWGDEGKGKVTDVFAGEADVVVRFQGGSNAGHTIINDKGKFALHQLPSGIFSSHVTNVIGNGVALNIDYLKKEIDSLKEKNIEFNLLISNRAQVLLPHHILLDTYEEDRLADRKFGSTKSGIAPFYSDKYAKVGIQVWQLFDDEELETRLKALYEKVNVLLVHLYGKEAISYHDVYQDLISYREFLQPFVADTSEFLRKASEEGKTILLEGQLGALKDTDHGIYPYVTSSSTLAGYASVGAGIPPHSISEIYAITKAYSSAVGEGPFVTELFEEEATELRNRGGDAGEYGATTGRPRRVGYFDAVATRYGANLQGATDLVITGLDVLGYLDEIPVCVAYEINGERVDYFPDTSLVYQAKPIYEVLPGWKCDIRGTKEFSQLPKEAQDYVAFIEKQVGVKVSLVSHGPKREEIMKR
jgi:adenylosuccinate synthase